MSDPPPLSPALPETFDGFRLEGQSYARLRGSDDFREGVEAFYAKRQPNFRGR
jgi:hypothetical protein